MTRRTFCIDANVLFDFVAGEIFDTLFLLPFNFHTSDIVAYEISKSYSDKQLASLGLEIMILDEVEILEILGMQENHIELSIEDISILFLSRKHRTMILSNDGPLRDLADISRIEYHGTLWLLEELIQNEILQPRESAAALRLMLARGRWLPRPESEDLINKWESDRLLKRRYPFTIQA